jgi:hypothetical protein
LLKPFPLDKYQADLTLSVRKALEEIPFRAFARLPMVQTSTWSPKFTPPVNREGAPWHCSQVSLDYLQKMKRLTRERNVQFRVLAGFLQERYRDTEYALLKQEIAEAGLEAEFSSYFAGMRYLPDELFVDDVHLKETRLLGENFLKL